MRKKEFGMQWIPLHIYRLYRSDTKAKKELTSMSSSIHSRSVWSSGCKLRQAERKRETNEYETRVTTETKPK